MSTSRFHLTLPAQTAHLQLVRLTVATLASGVLSVDEVEDVKVAIEELTAVTMQPSGGEADVHLEFLVADESLTVHGRRELAAHVQLVAHDFLSTILDAVCDSHELSTEPGVGTFQFVKHARGR
ncbi:MAG: hypothetical protein ACI9TF_001056 [Paracrocinitomix sp.]